MKPVVRATVQCEKCYGKRCLWKSRERNGKPKNPKTKATTTGVGKKPPASSRKIEANRRNASKSTPPNRDRKENSGKERPDVRAVKSPEPWPSTITRLSSSCQQQPQESWSCQH